MGLLLPAHQLRQERREEKPGQERPHPTRHRREVLLHRLRRVSHRYHRHHRRRVRCLRRDQSQSGVVNVLRADSTDADPAAAQNSAINTRQTVYLDVPLVKDVTNPRTVSAPARKPTATASHVAGEWYDPWGKPYIVGIDGNYDGYVTGGLLEGYNDVNYSASKGVQTGMRRREFRRRSPARDRRQQKLHRLRRRTFLAIGQGPARVTGFSGKPRV